MEDYRYTLMYQHRNTKVTYDFSADIGLCELVDHLRNFLCACSWRAEDVEEIIKCELD